MGPRTDAEKSVIKFLVWSVESQRELGLGWTPCCKNHEDGGGECEGRQSVGLRGGSTVTPGILAAHRDGWQSHLCEWEPGLGPRLGTRRS